MPIGEIYKFVQHTLTADEIVLQPRIKLLPGSRIDMTPHPTDCKWDETEHPRDDIGRFSTGRGKRPDSNNTNNTAPRGSLNRRQRDNIEKLLSKKYGDTKFENAHNAAWISHNGKLTGDKADHQESAMQAMAFIGKKLNEQDAVVAMKQNGFIRLSINENTMNVDIDSTLTTKQFDIIAKLSRKYPEFYYDIGDLHGNGYPEFVEALAKRKF